MDEILGFGLCLRIVEVQYLCFIHLSTILSIKYKIFRTEVLIPRFISFIDIFSKWKSG
jgi:hypothetical protein